MIPRLGDGNCIGDWKGHDARHGRSLENDSPSRGRKLSARTEGNDGIISVLENDSPSRGRKPNFA